MAQNNIFTKTRAFSEKFEFNLNEAFESLEKLENEHSIDSLTALLSDIYIKTRNDYTKQQLELKCFHASIFKYIYITLLSIEKYLKLLNENKIKHLDIFILTTQPPNILNPVDLNNELNPYFKTNNALNDYYKYFQELTKLKKINVNRYILYSTRAISQNGDFGKIFYSKTDLKKCFCDEDIREKWMTEPKNRPTDFGKCCGTECVNQTLDCKDQRIKFLGKNTNSNFYLFPINKISKSPRINSEIRELIAFKINKSDWHQAFTTNLMNSSTNMFIKFWNQKDLKKNDFDFIGFNNTSFEDILNQVEGIKSERLSDIWGITTEDLL